MSSLMFFAVAERTTVRKSSRSARFSIDRFLRDSPRIHVLSGLQWIDRKKRLAFVFERGGDWSLKQTIERQQVLRCGCRAGSLIELFERAIRRERFGMSLLLVKLLKDLSDFDQLGDSFAFAFGQF